ncbi:MAG TPA: hypothetical protein VEV38_06080 [Candidatus Eremiobacteraceae bacterium]|nr:hypothetical protein [Candidatus Eremiobacteraceae bacterium]
MADRTPLQLANEADDVVNSISGLYNMQGNDKLIERALYAIALAATSIARKLSERDTE